MVTRSAAPKQKYFRPITSLVGLYSTVVVGSILALAVLSASGSQLATGEAWIHASIVGAFALVLPLRVRAARRGSRRALDAVGIIAAVLLVVNAVEAAIPVLFPTWMRIEMVGLAALMALLAVSVLRQRTRT